MATEEIGKGIRYTDERSHKVPHRPYIAAALVTLVAALAGVLAIALLGTIIRDFHSQLPHGSFSDAVQRQFR